MGKSDSGWFPRRLGYLDAFYYKDRERLLMIISCSFSPSGLIYFLDVFDIDGEYIVDGKSFLNLETAQLIGFSLLMASGLVDEICMIKKD